MTKFNRISRQCALAVAASVGLASGAIAQEAELVGTWECNVSFEDADAGASMNIDFEHVFDNDGTYVMDALLSIQVPALQLSMDVAMKESGTWRVPEPNFVGLTASEYEFSATSDMPSPFETMMVQQMEAASTVEINQEQVQEISSISATTMTYEDDEGVVSECNKV